MTETANGGGTRAEHVATSVAWNAAHKLATVILLPAMGAAALGLLSWVLSEVKDIDREFAERDGKIAAVEQKADLHDADHDRRLTSLEAWREAGGGRPR